MTLHLYYHPFSSYCHKAMIALHEKELDYVGHLIDLGDERSRAELAAVWPYAKFPVLHDSQSQATLPESTPIIEYVDELSNAGPQLLPKDPASARGVRIWDRAMDNYLHTPLQKIVGDRLRPEESRDPYGVAEARATLHTTYALLDKRLPPNAWLGGDTFSMADCAAAPPLFYLWRVAPFASAFPRLEDYFLRLMARDSFRRCVEGAREYRHFFPAAPEDGPWVDEMAVTPPPQDNRLTF